MHSSSQQECLFKEIQDPDDREYRNPEHALKRRNHKTRVTLIQDVVTRWGSSYNMLERSWEMKMAIRKWLQADTNKQKYVMLQMKDEEWKQVEALLDVLKPFEQLTQAIGTTLGVSVHEVFRLYNWLFDQIESSIKHWKAQIPHCLYAEELVRALRAARNKLDYYYAKTDNERGVFYNLATLLDPLKKQSLYEVSYHLFQSQSSATVIN